MRKLEIIYCGNGNKRFADIAIKTGFTYGAQLPGKVYHAPYFVDQDWKKPNREKYIAAVEKHRPYMASVLDWERWSQYAEVMSWAEEIAPYVQEVMIIPKIPNSVASIPNKIGGKVVRLGFSVPTKYGGTTIHPHEFQNRPVHLLGGSPHAQMKQYFEFENIVSIDMNYHHKLALMNRVWFFGAKRVWGSWMFLREYMNDHYVENDAPYVAFHISCVNIMGAWKFFLNHYDI